MSRKTDEMLTPDAIRTAVQKYAGKSTPTEFDQRKWGAMTGWLNKYLVTDDLRHLVLGWLFAFPGEEFKPISSNTLTPQQKNGVAHWIGSTFNEDLQEWEDHPNFGRECVAVLNAARYDYLKLCGQITMDLPFEVDGEPAGVVTSAHDDNLSLENTLAGDEVPWCEWCGQYMAPPGVPCKRCADLGAVPRAERPVTGVAI